MFCNDEGGYADSREQFYAYRADAAVRLLAGHLAGGGDYFPKDAAAAAVASVDALFAELGIVNPDCEAS